MPYINSLVGHNPRLRDLFACIPIAGREHELLARLVRNNTEIKGRLFTAIKDITEFGEIGTLVAKHNNLLWHGHREESSLVVEYGRIYINGCHFSCQGGKTRHGNE